MEPVVIRNHEHGCKGEFHILAGWTIQAEPYTKHPPPHPHTHTQPTQKITPHHGAIKSIWLKLKCLNLQCMVVHGGSWEYEGC